MALFMKQQPKVKGSKVPPPGSRPTQPGAQVANEVAKTMRASKANPPAPGAAYTGAKRVRNQGANVKGKAVIPRPVVDARAKPKAEY
jgi:hypothetical protein